MLSALIAFAAAAAFAAAPAQAKTIKVVERARLGLVRQHGSTIDLRGKVRGTLSGPVLARFNVRLLSVTGLVTIFPKGGGSLSFSVAGRARSAAVRARFSGSVTVTGGTGRWAGARGRGSFDGVVNRRTWAATATVRARIST
ncbi:hypothetical protein BDZ31_000371 [Conexibacter arvalis]|uniref:DUF5666 domain-containing protein n=1 Tax=Conexibacter arvalis TaxID=912552 RepID=A0A840I9N2_9ACTN|nr:hypothetical protein [Conexibacter arvalis]